jgi:hypothetical protein
MISGIGAAGVVAEAFVLLVAGNGVLQAGFSQRFISLLLVTKTLDTYSHVLPNMQAEAAEKLDSALF